MIEPTPVEIVRDALTRALMDEDGNPAPLRLSPGLSGQEIERFAARLPCPLPSKIAELLALCGGFESSPVDVLDFTGQDCGFEMTAVFPSGHPIAGDGFGNFWVVDLLPGSTDWGPIYFACHDAPVILCQSPNLEHFLSELIKMHVPPHRSLVDDVHEDRLFQVWRRNPGVTDQQACLASPDDSLRRFAEQLDASFQIIDLRDAPIGFGFSWGRYGPQTAVRRFGTERIFGYQKRPGLLGRILGKSY